MKKTTLIQLLLFTAIGTVNASTVTHNIIYDISSLTEITTPDGVRLTGTNSPLSVSNFFVNSGDVLDTTVNFLNGQKMTLHNGDTGSWGVGPEGLTILWGDINDLTNSTSHSSQTTSIEYFTDTGSIFLSGTAKIGGLGQGVFGNLTETSFSFTGFRMLTSVSVADNNPYNEFYFWSALAGNVEVSNVPIPATIWLFSSGLIGFFGMRKKSKASILSN